MSRRRSGKGGRRKPVLPLALSAEDGLNTCIDYCGGRMFVVGYTEGGAPYGHVEWTDITAPDCADGVGALIANEAGPEPL